MIDSDIREALRKGVLTPLPRRPRISTKDAGPAALRVRTVSLPAVRVFPALGRCGGWGWALVGYMAGRVADRVRGRRSLEQQGVRLRLFFEALGGIAIKV